MAGSGINSNASGIAFNDSNISIFIIAVSYASTSVLAQIFILTKTLAPAQTLALILNHAFISGLLRRYTD